ncbi:MAG: large subunit ribosomal protein [Chloroflexia bacterium]|nr:large subunit ribosomal protein [Chloroflexia bacterium]
MAKNDNKNEQGNKGNQGNQGNRGQQNAAQAAASSNGRADGDGAVATGVPEGYVPRMKARYAEEVVPALMRDFGYSNAMQVPRLKKIVINIGMGSEARENAKALDNAAGDITQITGQKPVITRAKKSIAQFKLRTGMPIGVMVTLRGPRMWEFFDKLVNVSLARVRDFNGVSPSSFDGHGNFTLGLREQLIFPEIDYDRIDKIRGMEVVIVTSANTDEEGRRLLQLMGMPFRK